jgi:hypothetical protein
MDASPSSMDQSIPACDLLSSALSALPSTSSTVIPRQGPANTKKTLPPLNTKVCVVCNKERSAYKCPRCLLFYCSKDCCTTHKLTCGVTTITPSDNQIANSITGHDYQEPGQEPVPATNDRKMGKTGPRTLIDEVTSSERNESRLQQLQATQEQRDLELADSDPAFLLTLKQDIFLLSEEQKQRLRTDIPLQSLLRSKRLRADMKTVDTAVNRVGLLRAMRSKNAEFNAVVENMFDIVSKQDS